MTSFKTCESVCIGHPDKLCDLIADSILDECLRLDKSSRVACEVMATGYKIIVAGEITCSKRVDIRFITRQALRKAGYNPLRYLIYVYIHKQSEDIDGGVSRALESRNGDTSWYSTIGAGDQGTVYGYLAFYRTGHRVISASNIILNDADKIDTVLPEQLKMGDFVVVREADRDLIKEMADINLEHSGQGGLRDMATKWKEALEIETLFNTDDEIYHRLQDAGCTRGYQTVRSWLHDA